MFYKKILSYRRSKAFQVPQMSSDFLHQVKQGASPDT